MNVSLQELVSSDSDQKNWKGLSIAILCILAILGCVAVATWTLKDDGAAGGLREGSLYLATFYFVESVDLNLPLLLTHSVLVPYESHNCACKPKFLASLSFIAIPQNLTQINPDSNF